MRWLILSLLVLVPCVLPAQEVRPAQEPAKQVHWAVGAFFGTGWYQVDDNRKAFILQIPPRQTLREAAWSEDGERTLGIEIDYTLALGLGSIDDIPDFIEFENYATISFTPGVQVEIPMNEAWSLRPYAHLGYGWELESQEGAAIWYGGLKSRYLFGDSRYRWALLNGLFLAGYKPDYEDRGNYGAVMAGLEFSHPLGGLRLGEDPLYLNWHLTYDWFFDRLNFHVDEETVESFRDQWELGFSIGKRGRPLELWFMSFDQIGLGLRVSSNGHFGGITLNFSSPFTR